MSCGVKSRALNADAVKRNRLYGPFPLTLKCPTGVDILVSASWNKGRAVGSFQPTNNTS